MDLHNGIQTAFGWRDDHLYSFWLDGRFWGDRSAEYTAPIEPDEDVATADVPIVELGLKPGKKLAYVRFRRQLAGGVTSGCHQPG